MQHLNVHRLLSPASLSPTTKSLLQLRVTHTVSRWLLVADAGGTVTAAGGPLGAE